MEKNRVGVMGIAALHPSYELNFRWLHVRQTRAYRAARMRRRGWYNQQAVGWVEPLRNPSPYRATLTNNGEGPCRCDGYRCAPPILRAEFQMASRPANSRVWRGEKAEAWVFRCLRLSQILVVPDKRVNASADPGPIATDARGCAKAVEQHVSKQAIRRMGPRVRGDDLSEA